MTTEVSMIPANKLLQRLSSDQMPKSGGQQPASVYVIWVIAMAVMEGPTVVVTD